MDDWDFVGHSNDDHPMGAIPRSADDARFIATFDPEAAREVVGLLEEALGLIDDAGPEEWTGPRQWHARLDALLDRIGGDQ